MGVWWVAHSWRLGLGISLRLSGRLRAWHAVLSEQECQSAGPLACEGDLLVGRAVVGRVSLDGEVGTALVDKVALFT